MGYRKVKLIPQRVKKASACRAVYYSEEIQRIEIRLTHNGETSLYEFLPQHAYELAMQILCAYEAILPTHAARNWNR